MQGTLPTSARPATTKWTFWHTLGLFILMVALVLIIFMMPFPMRLESWLGTLVLLAATTFICSHGITGYWLGSLIDQRNCISLSRLQIILWTLVIFSAFLSVVLFNVRDGEANPLLLISIPIGLWVLMGMSATTMVGTPLIHNVKQNQDPNESETNSTLDQLAKQNVNTDTFTTDGRLLVKKNPADARWSDMFRGEEVGNADQIDLGKMQLFYFTIILVLVYIVTLGYLLASQSKVINSFPDLNEGTLALLGISHITYLTNKAAPHSANPDSNSN